MTTTISKKDFDKALQDNVVLKHQDGTGGYLQVIREGDGDIGIGIAYKEKNGIRKYSLDKVQITGQDGKDITEQYKQPVYSYTTRFKDAGILATKYLLYAGASASLLVGLGAITILAGSVVTGSAFSFPTLGVALGAVAITTLCSLTAESLKKLKGPASGSNESPKAWTSLTGGMTTITNNTNPQNSSGITPNSNATQDNQQSQTAGTSTKPMRPTINGTVIITRDSKGESPFRKNN